MEEKKQIEMVDLSNGNIAPTLYSGATYLGAVAKLKEHFKFENIASRTFKVAMTEDELRDKKIQYSNIGLSDLLRIKTELEAVKLQKKALETELKEIEGNMSYILKEIEEGTVGIESDKGNTWLIYAGGYKCYYTWFNDEITLIAIEELTELDPMLFQNEHENTAAMNTEYGQHLQSFTARMAEGGEDEVSIPVLPPVGEGTALGNQPIRD